MKFLADDEINNLKFNFKVRYKILTTSFPYNSILFKL
jgi:hypothetical protein